MMQSQVVACLRNRTLPTTRQNNIRRIAFLCLLIKGPISVSPEEHPHLRRAFRDHQGCL
jgi:hypothetical protein